MTGFTITARTIFHLGADLISSDAVALYELVKNAFDAGSESVDIRVIQRARAAIAARIIDGIDRALEDEDAREDPPTLERWRGEAVGSLDQTASNTYRGRLVDAGDLEELHRQYVRVNQIIVRDTGDGMSLSDLRTVFLNIGTNSRRRGLEARRRGDESLGERAILGEKGVGRLSTMRLGKRLRVETFRAIDEFENILEIDWGLFDRDPDAPLGSIVIAPSRGEPKERPKGTIIRVLQLNNDWSYEKLQAIAREQFARLNDPFATEPTFPIDLRFNRTPVPIPPFSRMILEEAHATLSAEFGPADPDDVLPNGSIRPGAPLRLRGLVDYRMRQRTLPIDVSGTHLRSLAGVDDNQTLQSLGRFKLIVYWFNRARLEQVDGIGEKRKVQELVNQWSGGVMVYRDGFRVGSYGQGADDWLDLDRKALASGGYKVNRAQIIGRLAISSIDNPQLIDQTNREGLRDSPEKQALVGILKHLLERVFRKFLSDVDDAVQAREPVDLANVADRVLRQRRTIAATLRVLYDRYPQVKSDPEIGGQIDLAMNEIGELMRSLEDMGESYKKARTELTVLAGIGLSVASIAHELRQATSNALELVDDLRRRRRVSDLPSVMAPLGSQLKTLLTRLRVLDPLVTSGRQVKVDTDLVEWVTMAVHSAKPIFERDGIDLELQVLRTDKSGTLKLKVVQGMVVQVIGNLLDNARYWLRQAKVVNPRLVSKVMVEIDVPRKEIRVSDNGPGVEPSMRETIFQAFVSTKPIGAGLGLGLFISREIAAYSGASLLLLPPDKTPSGMSTCFALRFGGEA